MINTKKIEQWVRDTINEVKTKNQRRKMIKNVATQKAQQIFKNKTGKEMTPSRMDDEMKGTLISKEAKAYRKDKKTINKDLILF